MAGSRGSTTSTMANASRHRSSTEGATWVARCEADGETLQDWALPRPTLGAEMRPSELREEGAQQPKMTTMKAETSGEAPFAVVRRAGPPTPAPSPTF